MDFVHRFRSPAFLMMERWWNLSLLPSMQCRNIQNSPKNHYITYPVNWPKQTTVMEIKKERYQLGIQCRNVVFRGSAIRNQKWWT